MKTLLAMPSTGMQSRVLHTLGILTVLWLPSCTRQAPEREVADVGSVRVRQAVDSRPATASAAPRDVSGRAPRIPLEAIDLNSAVRPNQLGDWDIERISDHAKKQLDKLGELISQPGSFAAERLRAIVAADYASGRLRPLQLATVYQDETFAVRRVESTATELSSGVSHRGISGCAAALHEMLAPLEQSRPIQTHFKIYRVTPSSDAVELQVAFELSGQTAGDRLQQRAAWTTRWVNQGQDQLLLQQIHVSRFEEAVGRSANGSLLSDYTAAVLGTNPSYQEQLVYSTDYWLDRIEFRFGGDPGAWIGMAVADVNGDNLDDLYLCQPGGLPNRLYVQNPDGTATDVSGDAGVDWLDHTHAALFVDLDNDSDQDLVLTVKPGLILLANDGQGRFEVRATRPIPKSNPYAVSAADYDDDGFLDLYVCCYSMRRSEMDRHFIQRPVPYHDANNGGRNVMLRNEQDWRFRDVTGRVGLDDNNRRFSFAAAWEDFDNDGDLDLYVANDYGRNNLYRNDRGKFVDIAASAAVEDIAAGMSVSWSDYNNDGWMDLYISNMFSSAGNRIAYQRQFRKRDQDGTRADYQRHARGNSLFQNRGDGTFADVSVDAGVSMGRWAWSSRFVDINNDGRDDLAVANGFITQEDTTDL